MKKYELSFPQKNIYMVEKLAGDSSINLITAILNIQDDFDFSLCNQTVNHMLASYDNFGIRIKEEKGKAYQYVKSYEPEDIRFIDVSKNEKEKNDYFKNVMSEPIDIFHEGKLYVIEAVKTGENDGCIIFKLHHLISDAWTFSIMASFLTKTYDALLKGEEIPVREYPSYTEFLKNEKEYISSEKYNKDKEFYKEYLKGVQKPTRLKESSISFSTVANRFSTMLQGEQVEKIQAYCKKNNISIYNLFLAALSTYLYRTTDNSDVVIGTPILNRSNFREKQMMGMFVSTMPVRINIKENILFNQLAQDIGRNTMNCFRHQKFPISESIQQLHKSGYQGKLYHVAFSYQNARADIVNKEKYSTDWLPSKHINNDLELHILDIDNTGILHVNYDYLEEMFQLVEIEYIHTRLMSIIENAIQDDTVHVDNIRIMTKEEENLILSDFNNTKMEYPRGKTIIDLFEEQVEKTPDNTAIVFENTSMTYRELNEKANSLAHYLVKEKKVKNGDFVTLVTKRGFSMLISMLATLKAGCVYIPIDVSFPPDRIEYMIHDSAASLSLTTEKIALPNNSIMVQDFSFENGVKENLAMKPKEDSLAYMIYTSGTTGKPKGCMIKHHSLSNLLYAAITLQNLKDCNVFGAFSTYSFDISILELLLPISIGATVILANEEEQKVPKLMQELIEKNKVQVVNMTPTRMKLLLESKEKKGLSYLNNIMLGGEAFPSNLFDLLRKYTNANIYDGYGPTEITVWSSAKLVQDKNNINIGKPLNNVTSYILDKKDRLLPILAVGELCVGGAGVAVGYFHKDSLTQEKFKTLEYDRVYKTGDLSKIDFSGELHYLGRMDSQIKLHGLRIELEEIERNIKCYQDITQAAVIVNKQEQLCGYYSAKSKLEEKKLQEYLKTYLPEYMIPKKLLQVDAFELTTLGKIDKSKLPEIVISSDMVKPETKMQKQITRLLNEILAIKEISVKQDLDTYGIDSLMLIKLNVELEELFHVTVSMQELTKCKNILEIESLIQKLTRQKVNKSVIMASESLLSNAQLSIINECLKNNQSLQYNIPFEMKCASTVDENKLAVAINKVIKENDAFSTKIVIKQGEIEREKIPLEKLVKCQVVLCKEQEYSSIKQNFVKPFDLLQDVLYRAIVIKTEAYVYLLMDIHHVIFDGVSMQLLIEELKNAYLGIDNGEVAKGAISIAYDEKKYNKAKAFYLKEFSEDLPTNDLITDKLRPVEKSTKGAHLAFSLDHSLTDKIQAYSKENKVTLNSIFLSMFTILLSKYMYTQDIILGIATSGRMDKNSLGKIGMFEKTIPFRSTIDYQKKVTTYIEDTSKRLYQYMDHSSYSISDLVKELNISRNTSKNSLFDVMFVYQNQGVPEISLEHRKAQISAIETNSAKFDMVFEVTPKDNTVLLNVEYCSDLYEQDTMEKMAKNYIHLLENIVDGCKKLKDIDMIRQEEKYEILDVINATDVKYPKDKAIITFFEENVKKFPDKVAIVEQGEKLTYGELNEKSNKLARYLLKKGIKNQEVVGILMDKSIEFFVTMLAILKCNAIYTVTIEDIPDERVKYMFDNAGVTTVVTTPYFNRKDINYQKIIVDLKEEVYAKERGDNLEIKHRGLDLVHIIYTSGTTGLPKGNMITNRGMVRMLVNTNYVFFNDSDVSITTSSLTFDTSTFETYAAVIFGMTWHVFTKKNVMDFDYYKKYMIENGITTTFVPTPIFNQMIEYDSTMFDTLKSIYVGGDSFLLKNANIVYNKPYITYNMYGPAENSVMSSFYKIDKYHLKNIPIGYLNSNSKGYIFDKCGKLAPIHVPGELYVAGDGLSKGYINRPELTSEKFVYHKELKQKVYKTGDLTFFNNDGTIQFLGRIDSQVKIRGQRIETLEIQNKILELKNIKEAAIKCLEDKNGNKYLVAYYTVRENISVQDMKEYLLKYLPSYMIPYQFVKLDRMPLNQNGKIDSKKLPEVSLEENRELIKPIGKKQELILNVFKFVLDREDIGMDSDYFENGGDSLSVIKLISKFSLEGIDIKYADLFKYKTPLEIYNYLYIDNKKNSISAGMEKMDYSSIDKLIQKNSSESIKQVELKSVLLTGVTGFLGVHVLEELVNSGVENVYCLVRNKNNLDIYERIEKQLNFFFDEKQVDNIKKKIILVEGDLTNENIFTENTQDLNISTVINCAAHVKHYGDKNLFHEINVKGVEHLIEYCRKFDKELVHISTLSVSGNLIEGGQIIQTNVQDGKIYDEKSLYIGQDLDNHYAYTKYLGEKYILDSISKDHLKAKIIRVGNLTGRFRDGKFQPNVEENSFSNRIKTLVELKVLPENLLHVYLEMTPIDYVSKAIVALCSIQSSTNIYHLFNHHHADISFVQKVFKELGIELKTISIKEMKILIDDSIKNDISKVSGIITDIGTTGILEYNDNITISSNITLEILEKLGFSWPVITKEYFIKYLEYLKQIGFLQY